VCVQSSCLVTACDACSRFIDGREKVVQRKSMEPCLCRGMCSVLQIRHQICHFGLACIMIGSWQLVLLVGVCCACCSCDAWCLHCMQLLLAASQHGSMHWMLQVYVTNTGITLHASAASEGVRGRVKRGVCGACCILLQFSSPAGRLCWGKEALHVASRMLLLACYC
jgi:hypothetical protein